MDILVAALRTDSFPFHRRDARPQMYGRLVIPPEKGSFQSRISENKQDGDFMMKKSGFMDSQILAILKQSENGIPVPELCREHAISSTPFDK